MSHPSRRVSRASILLCVALLCALVPVTGQAVACSCAGIPGPDTAAIFADAVFSGTVLDEGSVGERGGRGRKQRLGTGYRVFGVLVADVWKGAIPDTVFVRTAEQESACGYPVREGGKYLLFARGEGDELRTGLCSGNARLGELRDAWATLGPPPPDTSPEAADTHFVRSILAASESPNPSKLRVRSVEGLGEVVRLGPDAMRAEVAERLVELATDSDPSVRERALGALSRPLGEGLVSFDVVDRALRDPVDRVRVSAMRLVTHHDPDTERVLNVLEAALGDPSVSIRRGAVGLLGSPRPPHAIDLEVWLPRSRDLLLRALHDPVSAVQVTALSAVAECELPGPESLLDSVMAFLDAPEPYVRQTAFGAAAELATDSSDIFAIFGRATTDIDRDVRVAAVRGLGSYVRRTPSRSEEVLGVLEDFAQDSEPRVALAVVRTIGQLPPSPDVCAAIIRLLETDRGAFRRGFFFADPAWRAGVLELGPRMCALEYVEDFLLGVIEDDDDSPAAEYARDALDRYERERGSDSDR